MVLGFLLVCVNAVITSELQVFAKCMSFDDESVCTSMHYLKCRILNNKLKSVPDEQRPIVRDYKWSLPNCNAVNRILWYLLIQVMYEMMQKLSQTHCLTGWLSRGSEAVERCSKRSGLCKGRCECTNTCSAVTWILCKDIFKFVPSFQSRWYVNSDSYNSWCS